MRQIPIDKIENRIHQLIEQKDNKFGNARTIRNLFEKIIENQAFRITKTPNVDVNQIEGEDIH